MVRAEYVRLGITGHRLPQQASRHIPKIAIGFGQPAQGQQTQRRRAGKAVRGGILRCPVDGMVEAEPMVG